MSKSGILRLKYSLEDFPIPSQLKTFAHISKISLAELKRPLKDNLIQNLRSN